MPLWLKLILLASLIVVPILLYALLRVAVYVISASPRAIDPAHSTPTAGLLTEFQSYIEPQIKRVEEHRRQSRADLHEDASSNGPDTAPRPHRTSRTIPPDG